MGTKLTVRDNRFVWTGGFITKELPKRAGFSWNPDLRNWSTNDPSKARRLFDFADYSARAMMGVPEVPEELDNYRSVVLEALRTLSAVCDGAVELDGQGFSKSDAYVGHALAGMNEITAEQAALALPILRRHKSQLPEWMNGILSPFISAVTEDR